MTTIQHIEGQDWGDPSGDGSSLIQRCTRLRRKPLTDFTVEDLRVMLGQGLAVSILLPLAVDVLVTDPLVEGDYYPGDLLEEVLRLPHSAWASMPERRQQLAAALANLDPVGAGLPKTSHDAVMSLVRQHVPPAR
ncbi:contact-dependent growth inhibition system immunity protein [Actinoplanes sp. CA-252034]|uniref:contact-dependent growth inhibition system immunity protein n=1 Tax=Actinoplanes sp. CA-252034 TaxID=3239906 RepID=UPI003D95CED1